MIFPKFKISQLILYVATIASVYNKQYVQTEVEFVQNIRIPCIYTVTRSKLVYITD